jgi:hypothetical protein
MGLAEKELKHTKKALLRTVFAKAAIGRVITVCDYINKNKLTSESPIYYQLVTSIFILYARPFGGNNGVGEIHEKFKKYDTDEKRNLHDMLIHGRHKFFAHFDANTPLYNEKRQNPIAHLFKINVIVEDMNDGSVELHARTIEPILTLDTIPRIKILAEDLLNALCLDENKLLERLYEKGGFLKLGSNEICCE